MRYSEELLLDLLRSILAGRSIDSDWVSSITADDWERVIRAGSSQGVLSIIADAISSVDMSLFPSRQLFMSFIAASAKAEDVYEAQFRRAEELSELWHSEQIRVVVLKGFTCSSYYPIPQHRVGGDFDCYLCGEYESGNDLATECGAKVELNDYKHSHITYKGLAIENHKFLIEVNGPKMKREFDRHLCELATVRTGRYVDGSVCMEIPCADFNALFLLAHSFQHFITEGLNLRQICDWAFFLKAEQNNVNWKDYYYWVQRIGMIRYSAALTSVCVDYLGLEITNKSLEYDSKYAQKVIEDTLYSGNSVYNKHYSKFRIRFEKTRNFYRYAWKYHKLLRRSVAIEYIKKVYYFCENDIR